MQIKKILAVASAAMLMSIGTLCNVSAVNKDPNGDGVLNIYDAIFISKYLSGKVYPSDISQLDYSGNGVVSQLDVYMISKAIM